MICAQSKSVAIENVVTKGVAGGLLVRGGNSQPVAVPCDGNARFLVTQREYAFASKIGQIYGGFYKAPDNDWRGRNTCNLLRIPFVGVSHDGDATCYKPSDGKALVTVKLHGDLGRIFRRQWHLQVSSVSEAISAINANTGGKFYFYLGRKPASQQLYRILINGRDFVSKSKVIGPDNIDEIYESELVCHNQALKTIDIVPVMEGGEGALDIITMIFGAILIAVGAFTGMVPLVMAGIGLLGAGIVSLLSKPPKFEDFRELEKKQGKPSYLFGGPQNVNLEGGPVPIGYGRLIVGSQTIAASFEVYYTDIMLGDVYRGVGNFAPGYNADVSAYNNPYGLGPFSRDELIYNEQTPNPYIVPSPVTVSDNSIHYGIFYYGNFNIVAESCYKNVSFAIDNVFERDKSRARLISTLVNNGTSTNAGSLGYVKSNGQLRPVFLTFINGNVLTTFAHRSLCALNKSFYNPNDKKYYILRPTNDRLVSYQLCHIGVGDIGAFNPASIDLPASLVIDGNVSYRTSAIAFVKSGNTNAVIVPDTTVSNLFKVFDVQSRSNLNWTTVGVNSLGVNPSNYSVTAMAVSDDQTMLYVFGAFHYNYDHYTVGYKYSRMARFILDYDNKTITLDTSFTSPFGKNTTILANDAIFVNNAEYDQHLILMTDGTLTTGDKTYTYILAVSRDGNIITTWPDGKPGQYALAEKSYIAGKLAREFPNGRTGLVLYAAADSRRNNILLV